ncbi:MAG TPA: YbaK/EbsC family protein [Eubacteriaceae bacterium]|nr:YbaK/EbsC family protein [Eubacteriaceae bacterium]
MGTEDVRRYFKENNYDFEIYELEESTATVEEAAKAHGVIPAMIAKTLAFDLKDKQILIVTNGEARIDNKKYKAQFRKKAKMMKPDQVLKIVGHPVGGVCPFGLKNPLEIYLDKSLLEFDYIYPAAGASNSSIKITPQKLQEITQGIWVDVCS